MRFCLALLGAVLAFSLNAQEKEDRRFFAGGNSDISSTESGRARQAIRKWTAKDGRQDGALLTDSPFFWDHSKVGRPVFIRIIKNENRKGLLEVWSENPATKKYEHLKTYRIQYFSGKIGPKTRTGDYQAPEGFYYIPRNRLNPNSNYHLSMDLGYPNAYDLAHGRTGSYLMIHGSTVSIGCFAMSDCSIEQIYTLIDRAVAGGQDFVRVHSFPFEMNAENLEKHKENENYEFWTNLKEGWDMFEKNQRPPNVNVAGGKYVFSNG